MTTEPLIGLETDIDHLIETTREVLAEKDAAIERWRQTYEMKVDDLCDMCERCGAVASPIALVIGVKGVGWTLRWWGGNRPGSLRLCADCVWALEKIAGEAVAADLTAATGRTDVSGALED